MIYKDIDNKEPVVAVLERMLALAGPDKKPAIERELLALRAGIRSERQAAYLIDSHLQNATRIAVIHDLRLASGSGHAAQIDHVLIHRTRRFYVVDTKRFTEGMRITDEGDFLRWDEVRQVFDAVPSPLACAGRNAALLRRALAYLGVNDVPVEALVLVAPGARIDRPRRFDTTQVMKADEFFDKLGDINEGAASLAPLGGLLRTGLYDSIGDIAAKLVKLHRPSTADCLARFRVGPDTSQADSQAPARRVA